MDQASGALTRRSYDLSSFGPATSVPGVNWQTARGAFLLNGRLYYGLSDGRLYTRTFAGTSFGPPSEVNLNGLETQPPSSFTIPGTSTRVPAFTSDLAAMTGMFYDNGRLFYTVAKSGTTQTTTNNKLYYRYFNPESNIVGANLFVANSYPTDAAVPWGNIRGMTLASGKLIYALTDGRLYGIDWNGTTTSGAPTQLSSATTWQSRGMFVFNPPAADTTPPTTPGTPAGQSPTTGRIDLAWTASTDQSAPITYRIYRDGDPTPVGQTTTSSFSDLGLTAGSTHTYTVDAVDPATNVSAMSPASGPITVTNAIFADDFASSDLTRWTSATGLTIDATQGAAAAPSARGAVNAQAAFANKDLAATYDSLCTSVNLNAASLGGNAVDLLRLRTSTGGPIAKAFVNASGVLIVRSDFAAAQQSSGVPLGTGWHNLELCGSVGAAGTWDLYRDGVKIVNAWTADTGTSPIGRLQLGDTGAKTWTINFDDVRLDQTPR
jgi:chitodextrinase